MAVGRGVDLGPCHAARCSRLAVPDAVAGKAPIASLADRDQYAAAGETPFNVDGLATALFGGEAAPHAERLAVGPGELKALLPDGTACAHFLRHLDLDGIVRVEPWD